MSLAPAPLWIANCQSADSYVAFRAELSIETPGQYALRHCATSWYRIWHNGAWLSEGPARFDRANPEYIETTLRLETGNHCLAVQVHHVGCDTRLLEEQAPAFYARLVNSDAVDVKLNWSARKLDAYHSNVRRISPQLAWIEWCDLNALPKGWKQACFKTKWPAAQAATTTFTPKDVADLPEVGAYPIQPTQLEDGAFQERFFYEKDDPPMAFALRDLKPEGSVDGYWWRFDLQQVRLGYPQLTLSAKQGDRLEIGWAEMLHDGRVIPVINASLGPSANMDHYTLDSGKQTIEPLTPKGGRYLEIHYIGKAKPQLKVNFSERCLYSPTPVGSFKCDDPLLNRIWETGIHTLRACAEDAIIDNPTRERGQWLGDVANVGLPTAACAYPDLRVFKRGLRQSAQCKNEDGIVAALFPGQRAFLSSFALNWVNACVEYFQHTGDLALLKELYPNARDNLLYFERFFEHNFTPTVPDEIWAFIDWGYPNHIKDGRNFALYFHYISAINAFEYWTNIIGLPATDETLLERNKQRAVKFAQTLQSCGGVTTLRFHECILGLRANAFTASDREIALDLAQNYISNSFPMDPNAPDIGTFRITPEKSPFPCVSNPDTITPYFMNFALPVFFENGRSAFALEAIRNCWGWALDQQLTTWPEFFGLRGSHCHQWSACPTWLLSRYLLGIWPRFEFGIGHFTVTVNEDTSLIPAQGAFPTPNGKVVIESLKSTTVEKQIHNQSTETITLHIQSEKPLILKIKPGAKHIVTA
ncbi:family 78 glycoside hydrolase catalytic domain [Coraliomargarita sp. W4R53]